MEPQANRGRAAPPETTSLQDLPQGRQHCQPSGSRGEIVDVTLIESLSNQTTRSPEKKQTIRHTASAAGRPTKWQPEERYLDDVCVDASFSRSSPSSHASSELSICSQVTSWPL